MPEGTYLNCSYMAPLLNDVEEAGIRAIRQRRNPGEITPDHFFKESEEIRKLLGQMLNAEASRIVMVPSVSYGMANVIRNITLGKGKEILLAAEQFPSNYYPWQRLASESGAAIRTVAPEPGAESRGRSWNEQILEAITEKTGVVGISNVHWADGSHFHLKKIREKTDKVGAKLVLDGTQSVGALPLDVEEIRPDALICAGYKWLMGPYSLGFAYYGPHFDDGIPIEENWINRKNSEDFKSLINYQEDYQPGALRYEVGEHSNFVLVPMFHAALKKVASWTPSFIQNYCESITADAVNEIRGLGYSVDDLPWRASHVFGIRLPDHVDPVYLKKILDNEKIIVSFRGDAIRVSVNVYNSADDVKKLVYALQKAVKTTANSL